MRRNGKRILFWTTPALAAVALALAGAVSAAAHGGHGRRSMHQAVGEHGHGGGRAFLTSMLAPSLPSDVAIHGVAAGAAPWVLDRGAVKLRMDGRIRVTLKGLVIPVAHGGFPAGTARPVTDVSASLYCAPDSSGAVATTGSVPISAGGDARISDRLSVPSTCLAPIVLIHPNGNNAAYIAVTGWRT